ncbi:MAG: RecX family transcriptional regulator [Flavobacteriales bacterium]|nr:MAG: RecX family transcriptional regulator [Flavobacteriales bacterium]
MKQYSRNMSLDRAREKAMRYCSFQERCQLDITNRFIAWNVEKENWDKILDYLIEEDFLNESRYVEAFVRGKFKIKNWGKNKIKMGLMAKRVFDEAQFNTVVYAEIEDEDYHQTINVLIEKKNLLITEEDDFKRKDKLYRYMLNKGYESELVVEALSRLNIGAK